MPASSGLREHIPLFCSPTEPRLLRTAADVVDSTAESYGCDLVAATRSGIVGFQRKTGSDLTASMTDGRLTDQTTLAEACALRVLIIEGRLRFSSEGQLLHSFHNITRSQLRRFLYSSRARGWWVEYSDDVADTLAVVRDVLAWASKPNHVSHDSVPNARAPKGYRPPTRLEKAAHVLAAAVPGLGPVTTRAIVEHFDGLPLSMTVTIDELMEVKGVGRKRAVDVARAFQSMRPEAAFDPTR